MFINCLLLFLFDFDLGESKLRVWWIAITWLTCAIQSCGVRVSILHNFVIIAVTVTPSINSWLSAIPENEKTKAAARSSDEANSSTSPSSPSSVPNNIDDALDFGGSDLPVSFKSGAGAGLQNASSIAYDSNATLFFKMLMSIGVVFYLLWVRSAITPDFFLFTTCFTDD